MRPVGQTYEGTDRQCRGRLLAVLRDSREPVAQARLDAVWPDRLQRARALDGLVADGLVDPLPDGRFALPGAVRTVTVGRRVFQIPAVTGRILSVCRWMRIVMNCGTASEYDVPGYDAPDEDTWDLGDSRAYWRRRFLILCGGVVALGVCAWLLPGAHDSARPTAAASASMAALAQQQSLPPAATGSVWAPPSPTPEPTPSASPAGLAVTAKPAKQKVSVADRPRASAAPAAPACSPADIVLSLFTSQPSYTGGEAQVQRVRGLHLAVRLHDALRRGLGPGGGDPARPGGVGLGRLQARGRQEGAVHARRAAGADAELEPRGVRPAGCAGSLPGRRSRAPSTRWRCAAAVRQSSPVITFKLAK